MTYLGKENVFFFAPTITINLELIGNAVCTFKYATQCLHTQYADVNADVCLSLPCSQIKDDHNIRVSNAHW